MYIAFLRKSSQLVLKNKGTDAKQSKIKQEFYKVSLKAGGAVAQNEAYD